MHSEVRKQSAEAASCPVVRARQQAGSTSSALTDEGNGVAPAVAAGRFLESVPTPRMQCRDCEELLHELSNVLTGLMMSAQVVAWKLPPYSHWKQPLREIECNAQRGGQLLQRLTGHLLAGGNALSRDGNTGAESPPGGHRGENVHPLTGDCDVCPSGVFPKRDDGTKG
jgi:hypothetical protein